MRPRCVDMGKKALGIGVAALALGMVAGCGNTSVDYAEPSGVSAESAPMDESASVRMGEQIIRTANVTMEVDDVSTSISDVEETASSLDGFIQNQSVYGTDDDASASLTVRVPAANLDALLDSVATLGEVQSSSIDSQDVTVEVIDVEARVDALKQSITRLEELQRQADSVADLIAVEGELANRQAELESLTARRDYLTRQVEMSTAYIYLDQRDVGPGVSPDFLGGFENGWNAFLALTAGAVTAVGFLLPFLAIAGIITAIVFVIIAITRSRNRKSEKS